MNAIVRDRQQCAHILTLRLLAVSGAMLLGLFSVTAQNPPAPAAAAAPSQGSEKVPTFTTGSRLVVVDVTVKDKSGNTINGLKNSDFAVYRGQRQAEGGGVRAADV